MRKLIAVAAVVGAGTLSSWPVAANAGGGGCHKISQGEGDAVAIRDSCFTPAILHTDPGTNVTFVNQDPYPHNVAAPQWGWYDKLRKGDGFSAMFEREGVYPFACTYHPGMTGAVVVGDGMGAGSGSPVEVEPFEAAAAEPQAPAVVPIERAVERRAPSSGWVGWTAGGVLGLIVGSGVAFAARRRGWPQA